MNTHDCQQRSDEWFALRCGRITGTQFATMATGRKDSIETLCYKVAAERLTGKSCEEPYMNEAMDNGVSLEDEARSAYEMERLAHVKPVGFVSLDEFVGCSPDGLVEPDGGVEIKCPQPHTHLRYLTDDNAWKAYRWQIQGALWITGRTWWDFVSYCPLFERRLMVQRVEPDTECLEKLQAGYEHCRTIIAGILERMG